MPGLNIFTSNKLEILAAQLAQQLKIPVSNTLKPEIIVIQSSGMERWISHQLARNNGICANIHFPFPNTFLDYIAQQVLPDDEASSLFEPDVLMFRIMKALPECKTRPEFERLGAYLADDASLRRLLDLGAQQPTATITLDRPERLNAIDDTLPGELAAAVERANRRIEIVANTTVIPTDHAIVAIASVPTGSPLSLMSKGRAGNWPPALLMRISSPL